jgi:hypothetical protein
MITVIAAAAAVLPCAPASAGGPTSTLNAYDQLRAERLAKFIVSKQRRAKPYARELAVAIIREARRNRIPAAALAAIGWCESWWWRKVRGTSHEYGIWQIWPYGKAVAQEWDKLRAQGRTQGHQDAPWKRMGYRGRRAVLATIALSTALAARLAARLVRWCRARGHVVKRRRLTGSRGHRYPIDRFAHYNSGRAWPKPVYFYRLRRRYRILSRVMAGLPVR